MIRRFIFLLKSKSKVSSDLSASRKSALLVRLSSRRSARLRSSSETSTDSKSIGAMCSVCACSKRLSRTAAMPPRRSCLSAWSSSTRFIGRLLGDAVDVVAVQGQLTNQRIDLTKSERRARSAFQIAPHETVGGHAHLQRRSAGVVDADDAVLAHQRSYAEDPFDAPLTLVAMDGGAQRAHVLAGMRGHGQQLQCGHRRALGQVVGWRPIAPTLLNP